MIARARRTKRTAVGTGFSALCAAGLASGIGWAPLACAQGYPVKPIRFVVGFSPGGGTDTTARTLAQRLTDTFGKPVLVDNRPAQGGVAAAQIVSKAAPDGYTLIMGTSSSFGVVPSLYAAPGYDAIRDFTPVVFCSVLPNVLTLHPTVPATSVKELVALAKSKPGALNYASSGSGGGAHVAAELFKLQAGVDIVHVPYKGTSQAATDLLAGNVHMSFATVVTVLPHLKTGRLKALAVTSASRVTAVPDLPTMGEAGYPGVVATSWNGVLVPAGTPRAIVARLNGEIGRILAAPELVNQLLAQGAEPMGGSPEQFGTFVRIEIAKWRKVVKAAGMRRD